MSEQLRILQVIGRMDRGGAETMLMNLYRFIDRSRVQFDFVVHTEKEAAYDSEIESLGGKIYHCPRYMISNHIKYKKWWKTFLKEHSREYSAVHGHIGSTAVIYLGIAKKYGMYTIAHSHNTNGPLTLKSFMYRLLSYRTRYMANCFFACSKVAGIDRYGKKIGNSDCCIQVHNAIKSDKFTFSKKLREEVRRELNMAENSFVVGAVGRIAAQKNPHEIIEIFKSVHDQEPNANLLWVGDGEMRKEIEERIQIEGLIKSVILTGVRSDVERLMQAMDVFIMPSLYEGLPVALIEAQAAGLPCFCSDAISRESAITDLCKFLPLSKPTLWANEILCTNIDRKDMLDQIKAAGYDIETTSKWLENFYITVSAKKECKKQRE